MKIVLANLLLCISSITFVDNRYAPDSASENLFIQSSSVNQSKEEGEDSNSVKILSSPHNPIALNTSVCTSYVEIITLESGSTDRETVIKCSELNVSIFGELKNEIENLNDGQAPLRQLHITNSSARAMFDLFELIKSHYDCSNLRVFNASDTRIDDKLELHKIVTDLFRLEVLDLTRTTLNSLEFMTIRPNVLPNLIQLNIDGNSIESIDFDLIMKRWPKMHRLSATQNNIVHIRCKNVSTLEGRFVEIRLMNNPLNCDRDLIWLVRIFVHAEEHYGPSRNPFIDYDQLKCVLPLNSSEMTWEQRLSVLETDICQKCDCHSLKKTAIGVNCHNRKLTHLPENLPANTKVLNLTSNKIASLYLPNSARNWLNVTYVHLEDNLVTSFKGIETNSKLMKNLVALDMRKNRLQEVPIHILDQFTHLDRVHLSDNPWSCDCNTISFQGWLQNHFNGVRDVIHIKCAIYGNDPNGVSSLRTNQRLASKIIYRLSKSELCPQVNEPIDWLDVFNVSLSIMIILIVVKVLLDYMYQKRTSKLPRFFRLNL